MKFELALALRGTLSDAKAMEKYGSVDPYTVAAAVQEQARKEVSDAFAAGDVPENVDSIGVTVRPVYG